MQGPGDQTLVFYQAGDSSVHELVGTGIPVGDLYTDRIAIRSSRVRKGSPLAVIDLSGELDLVSIEDSSLFVTSFLALTDV